MNTLRPVSPLPWFPDEERPVRPYKVAQFGEAGYAILRGKHSGGGPFYAAMKPEDQRRDRDYAIHAANTLPQLEAEVARLRFALERIGEDTRFDPGYPTSYGAATAATLMREMRLTARGALAAGEPVEPVNGEDA